MPTGMAVADATGNYGFSAAGSALAGGQSLASQVQGESEEARRKRLQAMQQAKLGGGYGDAFSAAGTGLGLGSGV